MAYTCLNCGKEFPSPKGKDTRMVGKWVAVAIWMTFFCSIGCRDEWARKQKLENIQRGRVAAAR